MAQTSEVCQTSLRLDRGQNFSGHLFQKKFLQKLGQRTQAMTDTSPKRDGISEAIWFCGAFDGHSLVLFGVKYQIGVKMMLNNLCVWLNG